MQYVLPLFGRLLFALVFLVAGLRKVLDFAGQRAYMEAYGVPLAAFFLIGAVVVELLGALCLVVGYRARWAAAMLFAYLIPTTLIFHTDFGSSAQVNNFLKNLAIMGGLLYVITFGAGVASFDARSGTDEASDEAPYSRRTAPGHPA